MRAECVFTLCSVSRALSSRLGGWWADGTAGTMPCVRFRRNDWQMQIRDRGTHMDCTRTRSVHRVGVRRSLRNAACPHLAIDVAFATLIEFFGCFGPACSYSLFDNPSCCKLCASRGTPSLESHRVSSRVSACGKQGQAWWHSATSLTFTPIMRNKLNSAYPITLQFMIFGACPFRVLLIDG